MWRVTLAVILVVTQALSDSRASHPTHVWHIRQKTLLAKSQKFCLASIASITSTALSLRYWQSRQMRSHRSHRFEHSNVNLNYDWLVCSAIGRSVASLVTDPTNWLISQPLTATALDSRLIELFSLFRWKPRKTMKACITAINWSEKKENLIFINKLLLFEWVLFAICYLPTESLKSEATALMWGRLPMSALSCVGLI